MKTKEVVLTTEGLKSLEDELEYLKGSKRREIAEKIRVARGFGDLSENSEYDDAKNEQAQVEARIIKLESMLKDATVIDCDEVPTDMVSLGNAVKVKDMDSKEETEYTIVGSSEIDPFGNKISTESPVGRALLGKKSGDTAVVETPIGKMKLKIIDIHRV
jgi:transcription elongation factor GreA